MRSPRPAAYSLNLWAPNAPRLGYKTVIKRIRAENFKAWRNTGDMTLAPLTGLFGTNSSGKSSILQILLMLKQTVESPDRKRVLHTGDARSLVDLGTFFDLVHGHRSDANLGFELNWELSEPISIFDPEGFGPQLVASDLAFDVSIKLLGERAVVESLTYRFDGQEFGMKLSTTSGPLKYKLTSARYALRPAPQRPWPLPEPVKCYGFPDEAVAYFQNTGFLPDLVLAFERLFSRVAYLGPLRKFPARSYLWAGERPVDVGRDGDQAVAALLAARAEQLKSPRGEGKGRRYKLIEERIAEWLQRMELIDSFTLKPVAQNRKDYELRVKTTSQSPEVLITDVGFGVSQILSVLVLCYYVPPGATILLEQPEIHLHPFVQSSLADVLIDVVRERGVQVIVESHSEHLVRRLQRRVAEGALSRDQAAFYFCQNRGATARLEKLEMDMFGNILNWPQNFFGDEVGELSAMTKAEMERRKRGEG
jgi:predicted ATPase